MESFYLTLGIALVLVGLLLLAADLFIASGVLFVLALSSILVGLVFLFKHDTVAGLVGLVGVFIGGPLLTAILFRVGPLGRIAHRPESEPEREEHLDELAALKGRIGRTLSEMRPGGMVDFDGRRIDGLTEGMMVERGRLVRCVEIRAGQVIVRPLESTEAVLPQSDVLGS